MRALSAMPIMVAGFSLVISTQVAAHDPEGSPPEPTVTCTEKDAATGERIERGERIAGIDAQRKALHALHHPHGIIETRSIPGSFEKPAMNSVSDFALFKDDLVVINPGPGEYVHVMEGQRQGYHNLTIGITWTAPGGARPMHTHKGEESHLLVKGQKVLYALGEEIFVFEGPYMVNIPPMVPHSFQNLDDEVAELVVIFRPMSGNTMSWTAFRFRRRVPRRSSRALARRDRTC